jgi:hypothetical protein
MEEFIQLFEKVVAEYWPEEGIIVGPLRKMYLMREFVPYMHLFLHPDIKSVLTSLSSSNSYQVDQQQDSSPTVSSDIEPEFVRFCAMTVECSGGGSQ